MVTHLDKIKKEKKEEMECGKKDNDTLIIIFLLLTLKCIEKYK